MDDILKDSKWVRVAAILFIAFGVLQKPVPWSTQTVRHELVEIAIGGLAVAVIPIVAKLWPIKGEQPISLKKWALIIALMVVGGVVIKFQDIWFPDHPSIGKWLVVGLFVVTGMTVVLFRRFIS